MRQDNIAATRESFNGFLVLGLPIQAVWGFGTRAIQHALGISGLHKPVEKARLLGVVLSHLLVDASSEQLAQAECLLQQLKAPGTLFPQCRFVDNSDGCHRIGSPFLSSRHSLLL